MVPEDAKASSAICPAYATLSLSTIMSSPAAREQSPIRAESRTTDDEREPLLANESTVPTKEDGDDIDWRWYAFYGVLSVVGIALLALLIKGFIDSGDTDVSGPSRWPLDLNERFLDALVRPHRCLVQCAGRWTEWCCGYVSVFIPPVDQYPDCCYE